MKKLTDIVFDESGNTGPDLLNQDQPVFTLAATSISKEHAGLLLHDMRKAGSKEVKFSRLRRSNRGRSQILNLLSKDYLTVEKAKVFVVHKRYMVVTKIIDILIETLAHEDGIDLYKDGANIAMANMHFHCMPVYCGEGRTKTLLRRFVQMMRNRTHGDIRRFYSAVRRAYEESQDKEFASSLAPLLLSERVIFEVLRHNKNSIDPAIPAFFHLCAKWGDHVGMPFSTLHDEATALSQERDFLRRFMWGGDEERLVGYDRRQFVLPLRATDLRFGRSENDVRIQVADILASSVCFWANGFADPSKRGILWEEIDAANVGRFVIGALWPSTEVTPTGLGTNESGGVNPADATADFLATRRQRSIGV